MASGAAQQAIDYGQNFLAGQMTSLLSASGIELAGGTLSDLSTEIQNKVYAAKEDAMNLALNTVTTVAGAAGTSVGTLAGAGLATLQGAQQSVDIAKQAAMDVANYGMEQANVLATYIATLASQFPTKTLSRAQELAMEACKEELKEALKKITSNQEDITKENDEKKKENKTKNIVKTIKEKVEMVNTYINKYTSELEKDSAAIGDLMLQGPTWVNSKIEVAEDYAKEKIDTFVNDTEKQISYYYDKAVETTAYTAAKAVVEKTVRPSITKAQDALNKLNESKSKVTQKAKTSAQKALFKLAGQLGISPL